MEDDLNHKLNKQIFWSAVRVYRLQRVRVDVEVSDQRARKVLEDRDKLPYVTDHNGLMAEYGFW
jgi:hypothetical protein